MEEVYDLHQHPSVMIIYIQKTKVRFKSYTTIVKKFEYSEIFSLTEDTSITYDKRKVNIKSWGEKDDVRFRDKLYRLFKKSKNVCIDNFKDELYRVFKKDKDEWNEDDLFLLKAVSDFIRLIAKRAVSWSDGEIKSTNQLHYIFVVPSEWEEEIRETLLRPIFIQSNLISENDHNNRLLFCSELETIFYELMNKNEFDFEKIRKTIFCRFLCPVSEDEILIKLDLVSTVNRLFNFPDSLLYPKVESSHQLVLTINIFTDGIKDFIKDELPLSIQGEIIQIIIDEKDEKDEKDYLKPLITDTSRWKLDKRQLDFIESICIFNICSQICKNTTNNIDILLSNDIIKKYNFFSGIDVFSSEIRPNKNLLNWSRHLMTHYRIHSRNKNIKITKNSRREIIDYGDTMKGACRYISDVIKNANLYCRPPILPVQNSANASSVFQESKPDAIMNIDISIESTILSFSLLDENGFVKEIWNHDDFLKDKSLCSLGSFFNFSETTTLNVKYSFIAFAENYLMANVSFLSGNKNNNFFQLNTTKIETILNNDNYTDDILVSTQQQIYIKAFLLLYVIYIKYVISSKLSTIIDPNTEIKIGYNITVEKILLNLLFGTEEGLKDIIYASGLIQKDDNSKKLRITAQGERMMHLLQRSLTLPFPLNSFFVLAQLHENYIQLTLNKVVTESSSSEEDQEAVIIHDRIIYIPNIYTSLCLNMWNNIVEDSSLIKLCDRHQEYSGDDLEIFSLKNQAEFTENLKQYISKNNLGNNSSQPATDKINIQLSVSCNCRVYLTTRDIIDISFQPVIRDIVSLVSASFINKELFGKFWNIQYLFQSIQFDYNFQLHDSLIKMLKETTEDITIEQGVDVPHYITPRSLNKLFQPALHQQPISYKEFKAGTLHRVCSDSYGICFDQMSNVPLVCKSKTTGTKTVSVTKKTVFPLFKKGDIINDLPTNFKFYLIPQEKLEEIYLHIVYFKLKPPCDLNPDGTVPFDNTQKSVLGPSLHALSEELEVGQDVPILISVFCESYSGSLILRANIVGQDIALESVIRLGASMYLSRF